MGTRLETVYNKAQYKVFTGLSFAKFQTAYEIEKNCIIKIDIKGVYIHLRQLVNDGWVDKVNNKYRLNKNKYNEEREAFLIKYKITNLAELWGKGLK